MDDLWSKSQYLKDELAAAGFDIGHSQTPITPVMIGDENLTQAFSSALRQEGVYAKSIVFPTVPLGSGRIRNMPTAAHSYEQLDRAVKAYIKVGKELGGLG